MKVTSSILLPNYLQNEALSEFAEIEFIFNKGIENVKEDLLDSEILITYGEDLTAEMILETKQLKWIMVMSAGLEKMPLDACRNKGIIVTNARGIHKIPMAEYTMGMMLQHVKHLKMLRDNEEKQIWDRDIPMAELSGKTLLILGVGAIGGEIARLGKAFDMKTIGINRSGSAVDHVDIVLTLKEYNIALHSADFIVSVLPSTDDTLHILKASDFKLMKETAVFINIGRGDVVKETVIIEAMENNKIAHAYLDVFDDEPLRKEHPFWKMENITVTPHLSSISKNYLPRSFEIFKKNLHTYSKSGSDFINLIDLKRGY